MNPIISIENLSKQYRIGAKLPYKTLRETIMNAIMSPVELFRRNGKDDKNTIWALKDISFDVQEGEVLGIIGRNGAGKTTLLKILSRITEPTEGSVRLRGGVASLLEVGTGFHPELTGRENIFLNGSILGMTKQEIKSKFDEMVAFAEIEKFIDTPVKRYSSGMYVRLAFAVAAHLEPEILIVDEVLAVGDIAFQKKCIGKMGEVAKGGRTVLFVSHNMGAIRSLCQHSIWLDNGHVVEKGGANDVVRNYEETQLKYFEEFSYVAERTLEEIKDKSFYFSRVEMLNANSKNTNIFEYNGKMKLIVDLSGNPVSSNYSVEFRIYKQNEGFVCMGASGAYNDIYFDRKTKRVKIEIGPLILTDGRYTISLSAMTGTVRADTWENACSFNIVECHPFAPGRDVSNAVCIVPHSFSKAD